MEMNKGRNAGGGGWIVVEDKGEMWGERDGGVGIIEYPRPYSHANVIVVYETEWSQNSYCFRPFWARNVEFILIT